MTESFDTRHDGVAGVLFVYEGSMRIRIKGDIVVNACSTLAARRVWHSEDGACLARRSRGNHGLKVESWYVGTLLGSILGCIYPAG